MPSTGSSAPLIFGIYPGGAAGAVNPSGAPLYPENPASRLAALEQLRAPGEPFVLHLYAGYTGPGGWSAAAQVGSQVASYEQAGFEIELVLTYRPADGGSPSDVTGYDDFVRAAVDAFGSDPEFVSLQVTNEANVTGAPAASDGYYADVDDALISGVIAAKAEAIRIGAAQIKVGFNWAYTASPADSAFWEYLGAHGGSAFIKSLDWVGLDAYPGTWGPALPSGPFAHAAATEIDTALIALRQKMAIAHIPASVPLHVSETGYPTGPGRTPAMQAAYLQSVVTALNAVRTADNITNCNWFDLRDANSSSSSFEDQYGLMTDTYSPKPAFTVYQSLIAALSHPH